MGVRKVTNNGGSRRDQWTVGILLTMAIAAFPIAACAENISVVLDQAAVLKLPNRVGTVVVGNPLIADVSVQTNGMMVITGKGYGVTNMFVLDRGGSVLMESTVQVLGPPDSVIVYRGVDRESYSCAPNCERRINLGDKPEYFDANIGQTGSRNSGATNATTATAQTGQGH